jgi:hypothetical protein
MAEGLAAVGVATSIIQIVQFSAEAISRLQQFHSDVSDIPDSLNQISHELPLLQSILARMSHAVSCQTIDAGTEKALATVLNGCQLQIESLNALLGKLTPAAKDTSWARSKKAFSSLLHDNKVERITNTIRNYIATLTFYQTCLKGDWAPPSSKLKTNDCIYIR